MCAGALALFPAVSYAGWGDGQPLRSGTGRWQSRLPQSEPMLGGRGAFSYAGGAALMRAVGAPAVVCGVLWGSQRTARATFLALDMLSGDGNRNFLCGHCPCNV